MRIVRSLLIAMAVLYVAALALLYAEQRQLLFKPVADSRGPADVSLPGAQLLGLLTRDGVNLAAWYIPPLEGRPLVLFFHGNEAALPDRVARLRAISADGTGVLAVEYRGFGASSGSPDEAGLIVDAETAYAKAVELGFPADRIVLLGESLGTGVAVALAALHPTRAVILDSPYSSAVDVAADRYWMFPVRWLMRDTFRSDLRVTHIHTPLLILHGQRDQTVPFRFGERLFTLAVEPKTFIAAPNLGHLTLSDPEMFQNMRNWLMRVPEKQSG